MRTWLAVIDRTAVLFLGVAAGIAIGLAFGGDRAPAPVSISGAEIATATVAPPPPATGGTPAPPPAAGGVDPETAPAPAAPPPEVSAVLAGVAPPQAQLRGTLATGGPVRIGVFGDSFGDGVWSGLNHLLTGKAGYDVVKYSRQATGFTRYKSLNLEAHARQQLGDTPIDIAVVSYGANDTQGVIDRDGHYAALMSPNWQKEIGARVEGFVNVLRQHGATVYWVGLPRMRKTSFDADIMNMDAFYAAKMRALGVPFIDTRPYASDAQGNYAAYLPDSSGKSILIRADDGIHMSMNGYVRITRTLAERIRAYVDATRAQAGIAAPPTAPVTIAPPPPVLAATRADPPERPRPRPRPPEERREPRREPRREAAAAETPRRAAEDRPRRTAAAPPAAADRPERPRRETDTSRTERERPAVTDRPKRTQPAEERPRGTDRAKPAWLRTDEDRTPRATGDAS